MMLEYQLDKKNKSEAIKKIQLGFGGELKKESNYDRWLKMIVYRTSFHPLPKQDNKFFIQDSFGKYRGYGQGRVMGD
ncbi:hypothetical protein [Dickeya poaceiphila]|uniref:Uncharacterized protein n=1 Tax=Dickeya poaceiphila TaxID=568768 RepID=A0A5B8I4E2_9GAMM|nr:hypothetical protein [Dickeya poaceiphila]QDX29504.1 hypothetical protein Dpoa569_0001279 [Dickeya poaceiphila]